MPAALAWLFASLAVWGCGERPSGDAERQSDGFGGAASPPVVVVVTDTLRPDHLAFLGYERDTEIRDQASSSSRTRRR